MRNHYDRLLATLCLALLAGCAGPAVTPRDATISAELLLRAEPLTGDTDVSELDDVDVLALDQSALTFLYEHVNPDHGRAQKLYELIYAIITEGSFGLVYDSTTRTAQDTFESRHGNCLSFTNLFVAMAREVGIEAAYQEVAVPPIWSQVSDTYVLSRHINVVVDMGTMGSRVVDFNIGDYRSEYDKNLISDERALAHFYTNIGIEYQQQGNALGALRHFRKAIAIDSEFAPVWNNLGALYSQAENFEYAEAAYLQALKVDPQELTAMSNLGQLYEYRGQTELAERLNKRIERHRMHNPYYRYQLAQKAFVAEDYEAAIRHLEYSVKKKSDDNNFYALLGLSYLRDGNEANARRSLQRAEQLAAQGEQKHDYLNKLERLLGTL